MVDSVRLASRLVPSTQVPHLLNAAAYDFLARQLANVVGEVRGKCVLNLSCGRGYSSRRLAEMAAIVTGVDADPEKISVAQEHNPGDGIMYTFGDPRGELDLGREYQVVSPTFLLQQASGLDELDNIARAIARHLPPGGWMVGLDALNLLDDPIVPRMPNAGYWTELVDEAKKLAEGDKVRCHVLDQNGAEQRIFEYYYWTQSTRRAVLERHGFEAVHWEPFKIPPQHHDKFPNREELNRYAGVGVLSAKKSETRLSYI